MDVNVLKVNSATGKWTMEHGHLLGMGGITTVDPGFEKNDAEDPHGEVLTFERYRELTSKDPTFQMPKITGADEDLL